FGPGLTVRLLSRCEPGGGSPPAGGDERGARKRKASASLTLRRAFQRRPGWECLRPGRSVPTREAGRRRATSRRITVEKSQLDMYRAAGDCLRRFVDRFGQGRVRVDRAHELFRSG